MCLSDLIETYIMFSSSCGEDMEASDYEFEDETRPAKVNSFLFFYCF